MKELNEADGVDWSVDSELEDGTDHKVTFSAVDTVSGWEGTTRIYLEERDSSTATYLAQFLELDTDNIADAEIKARFPQKPGKILEFSPYLVLTLLQCADSCT
ncbi:hypothetical protein PM082_019783 [Marasmius tenuissimus]|nr:hypothetical protein PM082_019783 [Marasmius tenuissimus]